MSPKLKLFSTALFATLMFQCMPGGVMVKGGYMDHVQLFPTATMTRGAKYQIACWDHGEANRRKAEKERIAASGGKEKSSGVILGPPVKYIDPDKYQGGCEEEGQHSVFFLINLWPVTGKLNPHYALSAPVQKLEGDTMINLRTWHESHYYSLLGRVSVFKVRGDVIRFKRSAEEQKAIDERRREEAKAKKKKDRGKKR